MSKFIYSNLFAQVTDHTVALLISTGSDFYFHRFEMSSRNQRAIQCQNLHGRDRYAMLHVTHSFLSRILSRIELYRIFDPTTATSAAIFFTQSARGSANCHQVSTVFQLVRNKLLLKENRSSRS